MRNADDIFEVFGSCPNQRDTSNVDLLDDVLLRGPAGHRLLERIKVHNHDVDLRNLVSFELLQVSRVLTSTQDASEDFWMQGFYPSSQNGRVGGQVLYGHDLDSKVTNEFFSSAG